MAFGFTDPAIYGVRNVSAELHEHKFGNVGVDVVVTLESALRDTAEIIIGFHPSARRNAERLAAAINAAQHEDEAAA